MSIKLTQSDHKKVSLGFWLTLLIVYLQYIYPIQSIGSHFSLYGDARHQGLWIGYVWIRFIDLPPLAIPIIWQEARLQG